MSNELNNYGNKVVCFEHGIFVGIVQRIVPLKEGVIQSKPEVCSVSDGTGQVTCNQFLAM